MGFKSDEGSQFISEAFTTVLETNGIAISTDGKGSRYSVFVERLRKSVKYEAVYLYATTPSPRLSVGRIRSKFECDDPEAMMRSPKVNDPVAARRLGDIKRMVCSGIEFV